MMLLRSDVSICYRGDETLDSVVEETSDFLHELRCWKIIHVDAVQPDFLFPTRVGRREVEAQQAGKLSPALNSSSITKVLSEHRGPKMDVGTDCCYRGDVLFASVGLRVPLR